MIAYVPQQPALNLAISVIDAVKIGRSPHTGDRLKQHDEDIVFEVIEQLGLSKHALTSLRELSGGENSGCFWRGWWRGWWHRGRVYYCLTNQPARLICAINWKPPPC